MTGHDDQQAPTFTEHQARQMLQYGQFPTATAFQPCRGDGGQFLGYTFQVGHLHSARYGWIAPDGTYGQSLEPYRSTAEDLLVHVARDKKRNANGPRIGDVTKLNTDDLLAYLRAKIERAHADGADRIRQAWDELDRRMSDGQRPPSPWR
jgi:hypothetical protein